MAAGGVAALPAVRSAPRGERCDLFAKRNQLRGDAWVRSARGGPRRADVDRRQRRTAQSFLRDLLTCPAPAWPAVEGADAQKRVAAELEALGFEIELLVPDAERLEKKYASFRVGEAHSQIAARPVVLTRATGRGSGRSLPLDGHADVVGPGDAARWTQPPFGGASDGRARLDRPRRRRRARPARCPRLCPRLCARRFRGGLAGERDPRFGGRRGDRWARHARGAGRRLDCRRCGRR